MGNIVNVPPPDQVAAKLSYQAMPDDKVVAADRGMPSLLYGTSSVTTILLVTVAIIFNTKS